MKKLQGYIFQLASVHKHLALRPPMIFGREALSILNLSLFIQKRARLWYNTREQFIMYWIVHLIDTFLKCILLQSLQQIVGILIQVTRHQAYLFKLFTKRFVLHRKSDSIIVPIQENNRLAWSVSMPMAHHHLATVNSGHFAPPSDSIISPQLSFKQLAQKLIIVQPDVKHNVKFFAH